MNPSLVFDILVACAGAKDWMRDEFVRAMEEEVNEFRFQGSLGFGGKYWPGSNTVSCYNEDLTPLRQAQIDDCNGHLAHLKARS